MKRHTTFARLIACIGITLTLVLSLVLLPQRSSLGKNLSIDTRTPPTVKNTNSKKIKLIRGEDLRLQTERLRSRNKGLDRAMKEFAKRKRSPRWADSLAVQQVSEKSAANQAGDVIRPASFSAQSYSDGVEQIDFITYSGDFDSWEGIVYVHTSLGGETYSGTMLTPSDDGAGWDVVNETYYPPDGGDPWCDASMPCPEQMPIASLVDKPRENGKAIKLSHHPASPPPLFGWLRRWWGCVTSVCGWSDFFCTGSYRFFCRVGMCVGGVFGCM